VFLTAFLLWHLGCWRPELTPSANDRKRVQTAIRGALFAAKLTPATDAILTVIRTQKSAILRDHGNF
jgi:hypothetical protein